MKRFVSYDVGLLHLAYVSGELEEGAGVTSVDGIGLVDLTAQECSDCRLRHDGTLRGMMDHFFADHVELLDTDVCLIERQPPTGLQSVQDFLRAAYTDAVLVAPRAVHRHFDMSKKYRERKSFSVRYARARLGDMGWDLDVFQRKHDVADALLIADFWGQTRVRSRHFSQFNVLPTPPARRKRFGEGGVRGPIVETERGHEETAPSFARRGRHAGNDAGLVETSAYDSTFASGN